jgi:lipopolysaccharide transport system ATP-binding protein
VDKMLEISGKGRTLLFVSHDMEAINRLCNRVIELDHGEVKHQTLVSEGEKNLTVLDVTQDYLRTGTQFFAEKVWGDEKPLRHPSGVALHRATLRLARGETTHRVPVGESFAIEVEYSVEVPELSVNVHAGFKTLNGVAIFVSMNNRDVPTYTTLPRGRYVARMEVPAPLLNAGDFRVDLDFWLTPYTEERLVVPSALVFSVVEDFGAGGVRGDWPNEWPHSLIRPDLPWTSVRTPA